MARRQSKQLDPLKEAIAAAQEAVADVSDESLRSIAFLVVLGHLLAALPTYFRPREEDQSEPPPLPRPGTKSKKPRGPKGRIQELIDDGFFTHKRTIVAVKQALESRGYFHKQAEISPALLNLAKEKKLRRVKEPEKQGGKLVWRYSNW
ncbi:MAG: hypothetical protein MUO38_15430 [Anaerolineales bacterium]|nr:hypothetical protein [Anaerolineales bacterium]